MSVTSGSAPPSAATKGAMYSPEYLAMPEMPSRPGTMRPFEAESMPKMPIIARRPLLISATRAFALRSADIFLVKPERGEGGGEMVEVEEMEVSWW